MKVEELQAYELLEKRGIAELASTGFYLKHKKTGARVCLLSNEDSNKVFYIGFRTPAPDDTGVPHIMEHSVLCGSREFPVKDPFVELAKGSLNTFLNAMTYPDKTVYPVASCNDKDFQNLIHVYMDAVFYPNIYEKEEIFRQEGWHYEMESEDGELTLNGVVYNEMKGAFSSPEGVLEREVLASLYPDTTYANESGGDPEKIPELSWEAFLDFHRRYYHPSNSYIFLYGDCDMAEKLAWLDENYLSHFDRLEIDSEVRTQAPFTKMREIVKEYSVSEEESEEDLYYSRFEDVVSSVGYLLRKGPDNARALFVEPGTRLGGLTLMRLRSMILEQGLEVHGPCPHQGPCPLLQEMDFASETSRIAGKTWCHATFAPQGAPDWLEGLTAETGFARESLSLSWLEVGREQEAPEHAGQAEQGGEKTGQGRSRSAIEARVISNAFSVPDLGRCRYACSQLGLLLLAGAEDIPDGASLTLDVNDIGAARKDRRSGARILRLVSGSRALADRERPDRRKSDRMPARNERRR